MGLFEDMEIQRQLVLITNPGIPGDEHYAKQAQEEQGDGYCFTEKISQ